MLYFLGYSINFYGKITFIGDRILLNVEETYLENFNLPRSWNY